MTSQIPHPNGQVVHVPLSTNCPSIQQFADPMHVKHLLALQVAQFIGQTVQVLNSSGYLPSMQQVGWFGAHVKHSVLLQVAHSIVQGVQIPLSENLFFAFESDYLPYRKLVVGKLPRVDLVTQSIFMLYCETNHLIRLFLLCLCLLYHCTNLH